MSNGLIPQDRYKKIKNMYIKDSEGNLQRIKKLQVKKPSFLNELGESVHEEDSTYGDTYHEYNPRYLSPNSEMIHLRDNLYVSLSFTESGSIYCGEEQRESFYIHLWEMDLNGEISLLETKRVVSIYLTGAVNIGHEKIRLVKVNDTQVCVFFCYKYVCSYVSDTVYYNFYDFSIPVDKTLNQLGYSSGSFSSSYGRVSNPTLFFQDDRVKLFGFGDNGYMHNVTYNPYTHDEEHHSHNYINTSNNNYSMSGASIEKLSDNVYICGIFRDYNYFPDDDYRVEIRFIGFSFSATNTAFGLQGEFKDEVTIATYYKKEYEDDLDFYYTDFIVKKIDSNKYLLIVHDFTSNDVLILNIEFDHSYVIQPATSYDLQRFNLHGGGIREIVDVHLINNRLYLFGTTYKMETYTSLDTKGLIAFIYDLDGDNIIYKGAHHKIFKYEVDNYDTYYMDETRVLYINNNFLIFKRTRIKKEDGKTISRLFEFEISDEAHQIYNMSRAFIDAGAHPNIFTMPLTSGFSGIVGENTPFEMEHDYPEGYNFDNGYMQATGEISHIVPYYYLDSTDGYLFNQDFFNNTEISVEFKLDFDAISNEYSWYNFLEIEVYCRDDSGIDIGVSWEEDYIDMWVSLYDYNNNFYNNDIYEWKEDYTKNLADNEWHKVLIKVKDYRVYVYIDDELILSTDYVGSNARMDSVIAGYRIGFDGDVNIAYKNFYHRKI